MLPVEPLAKGIDEIYRRSLAREKRFYPLQQQYWVEKVREVFAHGALSLTDLREILPRSVEILSPSEKSTVLLKLFQKIAQNPTDELVARCFWSKSSADNHNISVYWGDETLCYITRTALLTAVFGPRFKGAFHGICSRSDQQYDFNRTWAQVKENERLLSNNGQRFHFIVYDFMLFARCAPDHTFVVVHYRDTASHRRYALFQSFETEYSLQEFLQQNDNSMDCVQFKEFLCSYFSLLQSSLWNAALETFYHKAFRVALKITYDSKNPYADQRTDIRYAAASLEDFLNRDTDFTVYKRRTRFPQILPWKDWSIG